MIYIYFQSGDGVDTIKDMDGIDKIVLSDVT